jgi:hypothetical protein
MLKSPHNFLLIELNWIKILKTWIFCIYTTKYFDRCKHDKRIQDCLLGDCLFSKYFNIKFQKDLF